MQVLSLFLPMLHHAVHQKTYALNVYVRTMSFLKHPAPERIHYNISAYYYVHCGHHNFHITWHADVQVLVHILGQILQCIHVSMNDIPYMCIQNVQQYTAVAHLYSHISYESATPTVNVPMYHTLLLPNALHKTQYYTSKTQLYLASCSSKNSLEYVLPMTTKVPKRDHLVLVSWTWSLSKKMEVTIGFLFGSGNAGSISSLAFLHGSLKSALKSFKDSSYTGSWTEIWIDLLKNFFKNPHTQNKHFICPSLGQQEKWFKVRWHNKHLNDLM